MVRSEGVSAGQCRSGSNQALLDCASWLHGSKKEQLDPKQPQAGTRWYELTARSLGSNRTKCDCIVSCIFLVAEHYGLIDIGKVWCT